MPTTYRPYAPGQDLLLPPSLQDWLPEGHLAYFIRDVIELLDLSSFYAPYEGDGRRHSPYEPRMMLTVLVYGYATGVFSSRKLAKNLEEDVAFRVLAAGNFPAHRTLSDFRQQHLDAFKGLFVTAPVAVIRTMVVGQRKAGVMTSAILGCRMKKRKVILPTRTAVS